MALNFLGYISKKTPVGLGLLLLPLLHMSPLDICQVYEFYFCRITGIWFFLDILVLFKVHYFFLSQSPFLTQPLSDYLWQNDLLKLEFELYHFSIKTKILHEDLPKSVFNLIFKLFTSIYFYSWNHPNTCHPLPIVWLMLFSPLWIPPFPSLSFLTSLKRQNSTTLKPLLSFASCFVSNDPIDIVNIVPLSFQRSLNSISWMVILIQLFRQGL